MKPTRQVWVWYPRVARADISCVSSLLCVLQFWILRANVQHKQNVCGPFSSRWNSARQVWVCYPRVLRGPRLRNLSLSFPSPLCNCSMLSVHMVNVHLHYGVHHNVSLYQYQTIHIIVSVIPGDTGNTVQHQVIQCNTTYCQCNTGQTVQCRAIQCNTRQSNTVQGYKVQRK